MSDDLSGFQRRYTVLQQQFCIDLPDRLEHILSVGHHWLTTETAVTLDNEFLVSVHSLAGSAGSYGFPAISSLCQKIEEAIREHDPASRQAIHNLLNQLEPFIKK